MSNFEKIEAYTGNRMTGPERAAFESELQTNVALKQDYADWLEADKILKRNLSRQEDVEQLQQTLKPLTQQYFKPGNKKPIKIIPFKKYMAAITAVAAMLILYFSLPSGIDRFKVPDMPQAVVRGAEELSNQGALLFNEGKYKEAIPLLKQQATANPQDATAHFFYAVCLVKIKQYETALPVLEKLANGPSAYKEDAAFFAALSAYKLGKKEEAAEYARFVGEGNSYYKKAQQLLKKLDE
ncbi:tetratricopeptide repeat protein [Niabella aquatica]